MNLLALVLYLFAATSLYADTCTCDAPNGVTLRSYSDNEGPLFPPGSGTFSIVDHTGCKVGYTKVIGASTFSQKWVTKIGKMEFELTPNSTLFSSFPIRDSLVAFPELAPYAITYPDAEVWIFSGNHYKDGANVLAWKGTGSFKKCTYIEVRCVFLVISPNSVPYIKKCVGCHWFFNNTEL